MEQFLKNSYKLESLYICHLCDRSFSMLRLFWFESLTCLRRKTEGHLIPGCLPVNLHQPFMCREKQQKQDPINKSLY